MQKIDWIHDANLYELRAFFQDWQGFFGVSEVEMKLNTVQTRTKALELIGRIQEANKFGETQSAVAVPKTSLLSSPVQVCKNAFEASKKRRDDLIEEIKSNDSPKQDERPVTKKRESWLRRFFFKSDGVEDESVEKGDEEEEEKEKENEESEMG